VALQLWAAGDISFIALGDWHYDKLEFHDLDRLKNKWYNPDDYRQVTQEYTVYTEKYWDKFVETLRYQTKQYQYVTNFYLADIPGYAVISAYGNKDRLLLNAYNGFNKGPVFQVNLVELLKSTAD